MAELMIKDRLYNYFAKENRFDSFEVLEENKQKIEQAEAFFNELDNVYMEREKYSLHWAFKNASSKMNDKIEHIEKKEANSDYYQEVKCSTDGIKKEVRQASRQYELLSRMTLGLDIVISVILILGITLVAQRIEHSLESFVLVTSFIGMIALLKVSLDRFYIIPRIDAWGWNRYHKLTHRIGDRMAEMLGVQLATIAEENQTKDFVPVSYELLQAPIPIMS